VDGLAAERVTTKTARRVPLSPPSVVDWSPTETATSDANDCTYTSENVSVSAGWRLAAVDSNATMVPSAETDGA